MVLCCCCGTDENEANAPLVANQVSNLNISMQPEPGRQPEQQSMGGGLTLPIATKQPVAPAFSPAFPRGELIVTPERGKPAATVAAVDDNGASEMSSEKQRSTSAFGAPKPGDSFESVDAEKAGFQHVSDVQTERSSMTREQDMQEVDVSQSKPSPALTVMPEHPVSPAVTASEKEQALNEADAQTGRGSVKKEVAEQQVEGSSLQSVDVEKAGLQNVSDVQKDRSSATREKVMQESVVPEQPVSLCVTASEKEQVLNEADAQTRLGSVKEEVAEPVAEGDSFESVDAEKDGLQNVSGMQKDRSSARREKDVQESVVPEQPVSPSVSASEKEQVLKEHEAQTGLDSVKTEVVEPVVEAGPASRQLGAPAHDVALQPVDVEAADEIGNETSESESSSSDSDDSDPDSEDALLRIDEDDVEHTEQVVLDEALEDKAVHNAHASPAVDIASTSDPVGARRLKGPLPKLAEEGESELQRRLRRQKERADAKEPDREAVDDSELRDRLRREQERKVAKAKSVKHFNQKKNSMKPKDVTARAGFDSGLQAKLALQKAKAESGEAAADFGNMNEAQRKSIRRMETKLEEKLAQMRARADSGADAAELEKLEHKQRRSFHKMETKLAEKLEKQRTKEAGGDSSTQGPKSQAKVENAQMDPKLAARLARQKEKEMTGESAVMIPKSAEVPAPQIDAQLASKLAKQQEGAEVLGQS